MRFNALILGGIFALGAAGAALAADSPSMIDGNSLDDILNLARGYGSATLGAQDSGAAKISGKIEGQPYTIYFSSCNKQTHKDCFDLDIYAGYVGSKPSQDKINDWNFNTRFARAYIDKDGNAGMDMDVNLEHGVTADNMDSTLGLWAELVKKFSDYLKQAD